MSRGKPYVQWKKLVLEWQGSGIKRLGRTSNDQITVCDLTGIAIQDLQIAEIIYMAITTEL